MFFFFKINFVVNISDLEKSEYLRFNGEKSRFQLEYINYVKNFYNEIIDFYIKFKIISRANYTLPSYFFMKITLNITFTLS